MIGYLWVVRFKYYKMLINLQIICNFRESFIDSDRLILLFIQRGKGIIEVTMIMKKNNFGELGCLFLNGVSNM